MPEVYIILLVASVICNITMGWFLAFRPRVVTDDAKKILKNLMSGGVVLDIKIIDSSQLFIRSPRG